MKIINMLKSRWKAESPLLFKFILRVSLAVSGIALAINTALVAASAISPNWWNVTYPYLIGIGAGAAAVSKLTKEHNTKENNEEGIN